MALGTVLAGFGEAGIIGGLPALGTASCFANWFFQKSSFFIWELNIFLLLVVNPADGAAGGLADVAATLGCNRGQFLLGVDSVRVFRLIPLLLRICKPLERISCSILNAITGLVKLANSFKHLMA